MGPMSRCARHPRFSLSCLLLVLVVGALPGAAQQQTGFTLSWSQGHTTLSSSRSLAQSVAAGGSELLLPASQGFTSSNVRRITRPDGSSAYEILDLNQPFSSYDESVAREREQRSLTRTDLSFTSIGYSVFHP